MPRTIAPDADPTAIGSVSEPPFVRLPDPDVLFETRRDRLLYLAPSSELGPYLRFLAGLADAQHRAVAAGLPEPAAMPPEHLARSRAHAMPPLDRAGFRRGAVVDATLARVFAAAADADMPEAARAALARVRAADEEEVDILIGNVMADSVPVDGVAEHVFVATALQVHFARLASRLPASDLRPVGRASADQEDDGAKASPGLALCPACGGPPVASLVVGWHGAESTRFCACPLCATAWHYVRVRCTACGSTKGVGYQVIEGGPDTIKAETCTECGSYAKVLYQNRDPALEPVADDAASLGLDLLMRDGEFRRASYNPFLIGY